MRKRTIAISFGTVLVMMCSSVSALALNATPIYKPTGPPTVDPHPPVSGSGSTADGASSNPSDTHALYPGGGGGDNGNGSGLGGGPSVAVVDKLKGKPLNVCMGREHAINIILARVVKRSTNQMTFFGQIATEVEDYVTTNNLTVSNYSTLVANISSDQTKVQTDINALKANDTFNCDGNNPSHTATTIKSDIKQTITDLQTYRSDVKILIVAVKAVVQSSSTSSSGGNKS